ncbi:MAG: hypothetical protein ACREMF_04835 [Gemmatimonadales bacterium]
MSSRHESPAEERRQRHTLRELLGELVSLTRDVARRGGTMSAEELAQAQERLEWLADEVWREASPLEPRPE